MHDWISNPARVIARGDLSREQSVIVEGARERERLAVAKEQPDKRDRNNRYTYPRIKGSPCALYARPRYY